MATKQELLDKVRKKMLFDKPTLPLTEGITNLVFGEGDPDCMFMFIGEAPGFNEDKQGRPFVGQAGKLLDKTLEEVGLSRSEVYITNIVKARPPDNRDPLPEEIEAYRPYLDAQIKLIKPPVIVTLGRFSMAKFLGPVKISQVHGNPVFQDGTIIVPFYHPAAALRAGAVLELFRKDFEILREIASDLEGFRAKLNKVNTEEKEDGQVGLF